jgi:galactokinase/mevalonate kinase-like predicted kinase
MIISRTPFRISFFGGGTDYPAWYRQHGGAVLATTIDKYCYLTCRYLPPFFEHRIRVVYSKIENYQRADEIRHPAVREVLKFLKIERGVEIHHDGDLPARGGMGSSSAFTVGLLHALYALKGQMPTKHQLAMDGVFLEQECLRETVGSQDQVSAAYGGFNHITFAPDGEISVAPITIAPDRLHALNAHLQLYFTGVSRTASEVAESYMEDAAGREDSLRAIGQMVTTAMDILRSGARPRRLRATPPRGVAAQARARAARLQRPRRGDLRGRPRRRRPRRQAARRGWWRVPRALCAARRAARRPRAALRPPPCPVPLRVVGEPDHLLRSRDRLRGGRSPAGDTAALPRAGRRRGR